jgi:hypothetical protein
MAQLRTMRNSQASRRSARAVPHARQALSQASWHASSARSAPRIERAYSSAWRRRSRWKSSKLGVVTATSQLTVVAARLFAAYQRRLVPSRLTVM